MTVGLIVAVSPEGIIGVDGKIPWRHPGDFARFKRVTMGATVMMGRLTWESLPKKPLPGRRNVVITHRPIEGVETYDEVASALRASQGDVWFIGGASIYAEAMKHADVIDVTYVPDRIDAPNAVRFPPIDPARFSPGPLLPHEDEPELSRRVYTRRG